MSEVAEEYRGLVSLIRKLYGPGTIALHEPRFQGNEKRYLADCIDSTFVSSVGAYVTRFEDMMRQITGAKAAIATVNGTAALHMALILAGVQDEDEVITQPLSFVATCNAIAYQRAHPVFVDVDRDTLSLSPDALRQFLADHAERRGHHRVPVEMEIDACRREARQNLAARMAVSPGARARSASAMISRTALPYSRAS